MVRLGTTSFRAPIVAAAVGFQPNGPMSSGPRWAEDVPVARTKLTQVLPITLVMIVVVALGTVLAMSFQRATGPHAGADLLQANPGPGASSTQR